MLQNNMNVNNFFIALQSYYFFVTLQQKLKDL